ncbi:MAG: DUF86 domain-containing protein [Pirellulales bacterium]|nr:DUF86 domain-containing protein [Pirellulales bacterium]
MQHDPNKYLFDIASAAREAVAFLGNATLDDYRANDMMRAAVERKLLIVGEAASRLARQFPEIAAKITDCRRIVDFRNRLVHGYDAVLDSTIWQAVRINAPALIQEVEQLLPPRGPS